MIEAMEDEGWTNQRFEDIGEQQNVTHIFNKPDIPDSTFFNSSQDGMFVLPRTYRTYS
jgi:hypothetical protein